MDIDLDTAIRTLVCVSMGQKIGTRVSVGLIVAVLARKFSAFPKEHIVKLVAQIILEEGGTIDPFIPAAAPAPLRQVA